MHGAALLCYWFDIFAYLFYFYSGGTPVPHNMVTYTQQELFNHNITSVTGGKLPQPLFDIIKDNGIGGVTRECRAGRNRQRTIHPIIGRRPGVVPAYHQRGVNNVSKFQSNVGLLLRNEIK